LGNKLTESNNNISSLQKDVADLKNPPVQADDDGDGVPNSKDLEPNTPKGSLVDVNGRTIPIQKTTTSNIGTASVAAPIFSVFFSVNSAHIDDLNQEKIVAAAKMLKENPDMKLDLVGHSDKTGGVLFNELLSKKRAQAVYDRLKSFGIDPSRLAVVGKGIEDPLSTDILSVNRRVDFVIKK
jgi:outer membrane protein OmpA-like peptidoglycan-associated protein